MLVSAYVIKERGPVGTPVMISETWPKDDPPVSVS
jgi:hypothetical protein